MSNSNSDSNNNDCSYSDGTNSDTKNTDCSNSDSNNSYSSNSDSSISVGSNSDKLLYLKGKEPSGKKLPDLPGCTRLISIWTHSRKKPKAVKDWPKTSQTTKQTYKIIKVIGQVFA